MFKSVCFTISLAFGICAQTFAAEDSLAIKIASLFNGSKNSPGFTIGIIDQGKLVFQQGYGMADVSKKLPNSPSVRYKVASLSKQFTGAAVAKLLADKKLALEDDIRKYLPDFPDYGHTITIEDLLDHTSGIRDYMVLMWLSGMSFEDAFANDDAIAFIKRQKELNFKPKERFSYSNSNYVLLAAIVRKVTGLSLAEYSRQQFFAPMGMDHTGFQMPADAVSYTFEKDPYKNNFQAYGDGGLTTTLNDLVKWDATFYDTTTVQYKMPSKGIPDRRFPPVYGMGIMHRLYNDEWAQLHAGAFLGYRAELLRFPKRKISVICLGNSEEIDPEALAKQIADIYMFHKSPDPKPVYADLPATGKYELGPNVWIDVNYNFGWLTGHATGFGRYILYPVRKNVYRIGETRDTLTFEGNGLFHWSDVVKRRTPAPRLEWVTDNLQAYTGKYHNTDLDATYSFFIENNTLWFKVGSNTKQKCEILKKYDRMQFTYKSLETATIDFTKDETGKINGFTLVTGRILQPLKFAKAS